VPPWLRACDHVEKIGEHGSVHIIGMKQRQADVSTCYWKFCGQTLWLHEFKLDHKSHIFHSLPRSTL